MRWFITVTNEFNIKGSLSYHCIEEDNKHFPLWHLSESMAKVYVKREFFYRSHVYVCVQRQYCIRLVTLPVVCCQQHHCSKKNHSEQLNGDALQKSFNIPSWLFWLRVIKASKAILGREESIKWNVPWFSHRNCPPSTRLNIRHNEWHKLLYPLIIKIRIMT